MDLQLQDRVIFVAGGSRGIGLGIVERLLAEGARVAITARGAEALEATRARLAAQYGEDRVWAMPGDMRATMTIETALDRTEAEFGPIFGAVANVGLHPCPPGFDIDDATWDGGFSQNLDSAYRLARPVLRRLTERGEGSLLFISSIAGLAALGTPLTYGTAKAAVDRSMQYATRDRKAKKRTIRGLWIQRLNAAVREFGITYSRFIDGLNKASVTIDRKVLSDLAINQPAAFAAIVEQAKAALPSAAA